MPRLAVATQDQIEGIYAESHALWGAGLRLEDYVAMWSDLGCSRWGRQWFHSMVWLDPSGEVLSSLKLYQPLVRAGGVTARSCAIGAVFTPRRHRRQGHAAALIRSVVEASRGIGHTPALLFSDIGTDYYRAMGFRELPCEESVGSLGKDIPGSPPGWGLRPMTDSDLEDVAACHDAWCASRLFAILRDLEHWRFLRQRARTFFARLDGSDLTRRYRVATRDGRFAGYLISVDGDGEWNLREAGVREGVDGELVALLRTAAADARAAGNRRIYGWFPREWARLVPEWRLRWHPRARAVAMALPLGASPRPLPFDDVNAAFVPYLDQF